MRRLLTTLLLAPALTVADPNDFARGRPLATSGDSVVQRLLLPADVYEWVTRTDLGDVRVFNGAGTVVPHAIRRAPARAEHGPWRRLPLFPLPAAETPGGEAAAVDIDLGAGGAVVAVRGATSTPGERPGYLIDASAEGEPIHELRLDWAEQEGFVARFALEASDDLTSWRTVTPELTVAVLAAEAARVEVREAAVGGPADKYLRLTRLAGGPPVTITGAEVRARTAPAAERHWKSVPGTKDDARYRFDLGARLPVDRVRLSLPGRSWVVAAQLESRPDRHSVWQSRGHHTFYRVSVDGANAASEALAVGTTYDPHWRVTPDTPAAAPPTLEVGWLAHELVFVAEGPPPFLLAYGRAALAGEPWPMDDVLAQLADGVDLDALPRASVEPATVLGGPRRLEPGPQPVDWQTILLWAVLVGGVVLVGGLAYRLLRG